MVFIFWKLSNCFLLLYIIKFTSSLIFIIFLYLKIKLMQKTIIGSEKWQMHHMVGDGFRVTNLIPGYGQDMNNMTSPFLMLDYNAPWKLEPQKNGHRPWVGFHPHRGFETVTIVYSWEVEHRDTAGNGGTIGADEVQWMTAGSGLLHEEFMTAEFSRTGGIQHAVQLWVNLPKIHKMTDPHYQALTRESITEIPFDSGKVRVIAGNLKLQNSDGTTETSSWSADTFSPVELYDLRFTKSGRIDFLIEDGYTTMILVTEWDIEIWNKTYKNGELIHLSRSGNEVSIIWKENAKILVMAGKPIDEPIAHYGPFVMNTHTEIMQAFTDLNDGKMWKIPENTL